MRERITINDVARLAGVSKRTVSRVINNSPMVGAKSRDRVKQIIDDLGYQPSPQARGLASSRSYLLGMIYDNPDAYFIDSLLRGISSVCLENGYELVVHPCESENDDLADRTLSFTSRAQIDGIIIPPPLSENNELAAALEEAGVPVVRLAASQFDTAERIVVSDERAGARKMTEYLIGQGHRRIGYITGTTGLVSTAERREGYRDALRGCGLPVDEALVATGAYSFESGIEAGTYLLSLDHPPTAIFASNDQMAIGAIHAAREKGLDVPSEISVAGFDDSAVASQILPGLTTIRRPVRRMATAATRKLIARIDGREEEAAETSILAPELVLRDSVAQAG